jgi:transcriptional/translational regulatory protein YebC/TACO1
MVESLTAITHGIAKCQIAKHAKRSCGSGTNGLPTKTKRISKVVFEGYSPHGIAVVVETATT